MNGVTEQGIWLKERKGEMNKQKTVLECNLFKFRLFCYCINLCIHYSSKYLKLMLQSVFNFAIFSNVCCYKLCTFF